MCINNFFVNLTYLTQITFPKLCTDMIKTKIFPLDQTALVIKAPADSKISFFYNYIFSPNLNI